MKEIETYRGAVYPWHCDFNEHMNVQHYMGKFDEATWHFMAAIGVTPSYLKKEKRAIVAVEQNIRYYEELYAGDLIYIKTALVEYKPKAVIILHKMINVETACLVVEAKMVGVHMDKRTRSSTAFTEDLNQKMNAFIKNESVV